MKKILQTLILFIAMFSLNGQNNGVVFDGVDDQIIVCHDDAFNIGAGFTLEAWIFANNWKNESWQGSIITKDGVDQSGFAYRAGKNGSLSFTLGVGNIWPEIQTSPIMNEKQWYHTAAVVQDETISLYINGELVESTSFTGPADHNLNQLKIGESAGFPGRNWDGILDEVRIWNVARTAQEISDNHKVELEGTEAGLVLYYPMDEGMGNTLEDKVGTCAGSIQGGTWGEGWTVPAIDGGVTAITSPDILSIYERAVKVSVSIQNFGSEAISDIPVELSINGLPALTENYSGTLQPGESADFVFEQPILVKENNTNLLTAKTALTDDTNSLNDATSYRYRSPDDGSVVKVLNDEQHNFGSAGQTRFTKVNMPLNMEEFDQILLHIWVDCPSTGCDPWDQTGKISFVSTDGVEYEVARFITPYGKACGPWTVDITDFKSVIGGPVLLKSFIQVFGQSGWLLNTEVEFVKGNNNVYQDIQSLWQTDYLVYGDPGIDDDLPEQSVQLNSNMKSSHIRMTMSGHGQGNTDNAAEFSTYTHDFVLNGSVVNNHLLWKDDCAQNVCSNQGGNWTPNRAGWCPGQQVSPYIVNLEGEVSAGESITVDYDLQDYTNLLNTGYNNTGHTEPHYRIHGFLVETSDVHLKPSTNLRASKVAIFISGEANNPEFNAVVMSVINTGNEKITDPVLGYSVNGTIISNETYSGTINAGEEIEYSFSTVDGFTAGQDNLIIGYTNSKDDNVNDNATANNIDENLVDVEETLEASISVYPNPSNGTFTIELEDELIGAEITISSSTGQILKQGKSYMNRIEYNLETSGLYLVEIRTEDDRRVIKRIAVVK